MSAPAERPGTEWVEYRVSPEVNALLVAAAERRGIAVDELLNELLKEELARDAAGSAGVEHPQGFSEP